MSSRSQVIRKGMRSAGRRVGRRPVVMSGARALGALMLAAGLAGCLEQEQKTGQSQGAGTPITTASIGNAAGNPLAVTAHNGGAENGIDAFLSNMKREARLRKQEAIRMRAQVAAYREAVREAREMAAKYRLEIARIQEEIRREREEMEKYKAEINVLRQEMLAQAMSIGKDRDQLRRLAEEAEKARREMALIRQGVLHLRDDLLPRAAAGGPAGRRNGDNAAATPSVPASAIVPQTVPAASGNRPKPGGDTAVKVRVRQQENGPETNASDTGKR